MGENPSPLDEDFSVVNSKFEYLNPKQIQNPNDGNPKQPGTSSWAHRGRLADWTRGYCCCLKNLCFGNSILSRI